MAYTMKKNLANPKNYGGERSTGNVKYIVIHYTGNDGDTDENNGKYFHNNVVKASAHYIVDDDSVTQSVPDNCVAWSVGGSKYSNCSQTGGGKFYKKCTNANSISIEICDDVKNGKVYPSAKTIANALNLTKTLMKKYGIPAANVIRHFDVNGKGCPAYWCGTTERNEKWKTEFWNKLVVANSAATAQTVSNAPYKVKVSADELNVRAGAGASYAITAVVRAGEVYTIVAEKKNGSTTWGKLKSGAGWISLKYTKKV